MHLSRGVAARKYGWTSDLNVVAARSVVDVSWLWERDEVPHRLTWACVSRGCGKTPLLRVEEDIRRLVCWYSIVSSLLVLSL